MGNQRRDVVIVGAARTPIGSFLGALSGLSAPRLGAVAIREALHRASVAPDLVDEVIMGNVLQAGVGQAPARQAALFAGLPTKVECLTINKVCGSGLKAVMLAEQAIALGDAEIIVAGGMESMSNAPYLLERARTGYRLGHGEIVDSMIKDGLWDVYNDFHMGNAGELCARRLNISREEQDEYAAESYRRALRAQEQGLLAEEIVPIEVPQAKGGTVLVTEDEEPKRANFEKMKTLKPAFEPEGTITPANASKINDGAAAVVLMSYERANAMGVTPLARIVTAVAAARQPEEFTVAPVDAIQKVLKRAGLSLSDIDLFEINEAFAVVALAAIRLLELDPKKVNVNGGAVAFGHPIGASGARLLTTLLYEMKRRQARRGLVTLCIGGGEAVAMVVER
ncbi:MAG: acetyl-CoA C-acetyltransferase [Blastocatellia bacterium]|nr:acetyl-CoA C-acetyltransferase [Blastocatellia bacterium]MCS7157679.1 acetyl-CoA C-acetyltransferase [Blastocatellia bacterium]MCX7751944.1 acetyl-CoA C-acetyltransferase [Blastocatellia bacterium]MDW8167050.1 acetyl-CoA C-acetyltransferase [Acidobacteriota bacterium]MDW8257154.1 acetyl-CoA C-acetyltransferase [Acidobacteriota bacterium]